MKKFIYLATFCATFALTSCNNEEDIVSKNTSIERETYAPQVFAKSLALALNNNESLRDFIKEEALKQKDGDFEILIAEVIDKKATAESTLRSSGEETSLTLRECLLQTESVTTYAAAAQTSGSNNSLSIVSALKNIENNYPLLQIAIPNMENASWESIVSGNSPFYVTFLPMDYNEGDDVLAYDQNGKESILDGETEPNTPVIVISESERISCSSSTMRSNEISDKKVYYKSANRTYYLEYEEPETTNKVDLRAGGSSIWKAKFASQSAMRKYEPWTKGRPEIAVVIFNNKTMERVKHEFGDKGWYDGKERILNFSYSVRELSAPELGQIIYYPVVFAWWELDTEFNIGRIFGKGNQVVPIPDTPNGVKISVSIPIGMIGDSNDFIGYAFTIDHAKSGTQYKTIGGKHGSGHFYFWITK